MPRVIAGSAGGLHLTAPKGDIRPTQDRIKQVIFSSLGDFIFDQPVLDLYAGTGGLGIEALSRGAASATFVESNRDCSAAIEKNLQLCSLKGEIHRQDALVFLRTPPTQKYGLILADPPYDKQKGSLVNHPLLSLVVPWLAEGGIFVWEHFSAQEVQEVPPWVITRHRTYGETGLTFLKKAV